MSPLTILGTILAVLAILIVNSPISYSTPCLNGACSPFLHEETDHIDKRLFAPKYRAKTARAKAKVLARLRALQRKGKRFVPFDYSSNDFDFWQICAVIHFNCLDQEVYNHSKWLVRPLSIFVHAVKSIGKRYFVNDDIQQSEFLKEWDCEITQKV